jgi:hypothetical protein
MVCLVVLPLLWLTACSGDAGSASEASVSASPVALDTSVPADDPTLPRTDAAGNYPTDVLLAFVRAINRGDWKTAYALLAPPKGSYRSLARHWAGNRVPYDDFVVHETRIVAPGKALVRVTYSTIGFSSLEGVPEEQRGVIVIREPGRWWMLVKEDSEPADWQVTFTDPAD